jgi:hypothetical protein
MLAKRWSRSPTSTKRLWAASRNHPRPVDEIDDGMLGEPSIDRPAKKTEPRRLLVRRHVDVRKLVLRKIAPVRVRDIRFVK